jgi:hypothetical protein
MSPSNLIDARGPRFAATITTLILAWALLTQSVWLLLAQTVVFAIGARLGPHRSPYGLLFRKLVVVRLAPPTKFEDIKPPQFAQLVGLLFGVVALIGAVLEVPAIFAGAVSAALAAAFLNSVFGYCLGCEMYLLIKRVSRHGNSIRAFGAR